MIALKGSGPFGGRGRLMVKILLSLGFLASSSPGAPAQEPKLGRFKEKFAEKHPLSKPEVFWERTGFTPRAVEGYSLEEESFEIYVPKGYKKGTPFGLFVYISPVPSGAPHKGWLPFFDKYSLIFVGANNSGNERFVWYRTFLALDAVHNMKSRYTIDEDRIYASGIAGAGRTAAFNGLCFSEIFMGTFFISGASFYRNVDVVGGSGFFRPDIPKVPDKPVLERLRTLRRFVFFTAPGSDLERSALAVYENGFKKEGYRHLEEFRPPKGQTLRTHPEWFGKALVSLDRPLLEASQSRYLSAKKLEKAKKFKEALKAYSRAAAHGWGMDFQEEARLKAEELRPSVDILSNSAYDTLTSRKASARKLRAFAEEWSGFPGGAKAREAANNLGQDELDKIAVKKGTSLRKALQKFLVEWKGYPVSGLALETLDREAQEEFTKIERVRSERSRHAKMRSFAKTWAPSSLARQAIKTVEDAAKEMLEEAKNEESPRVKLAKLSVIVRYYSDTTAGREAKWIMDKLNKKK